MKIRIEKSTWKSGDLDHLEYEEKVVEAPSIVDCAVSLWREEFKEDRKFVTLSGYDTRFSILSSDNDNVIRQVRVISEFRV